MTRDPQPTLREIVADVTAGRRRCREVVDAALARCDALEPDVQAWVCQDRARVRAQADAADARRAGGAPARALEGVPLGVKDIIDVAGLPTRMGSALTDDAPAAVTADCVRRLEDAGAIVLGKTVTTEFAYYTPGCTRNPWNTAHTPGGSSSGSAAAVACGMVAGALGTQTNGSIIRPAAFCGVVGYKPSLGAISSDGTLDPWPSLDHTGVFARDVADAALLAHVMSNGIVPAAVDAGGGQRLLVVRTPVWREAEPHGQAAFLATVERLQAAGADVTARELPADFDAAHAALRALMAREAWLHFGSLRETQGAGLSPQLRALIDEGAALDDDAYPRALGVQHALRERYADFVAAFDAVLTPATPGEAPATLTQTGSPVFCSLWSLLGVPAITVPCALGPSGLPLGLQISAAFGAEAAVLDAAAWCAAQLDFPQLNPGTKK